MYWTPSVSGQLFSFLAFLTVTKIQARLLIQLVSNSSVVSSTLTIHSQKQSYVTTGASVALRCLHSKTKNLSTELNCSGLSWEWNDTEDLINWYSTLGKQCVSMLKIENVTWFGKRIFRCVYKRNGVNAASSFENISLTVISGHKPEAVINPTLRWIEDKVEITWTPAENNRNNSVRYMVECTGEKYSFNSMIPGNCRYFKLNNCSQKKAFYCRVSFLAILEETYVIRVIAENKFGKMFSDHFKITIPVFQEEMIPEPIFDLDVFSTTETIKLEWNSAPHDLQKKISYTCYGNQTTYENFTKRDVYEISNKILPVFEDCTFCVSRQRYQEGQFSCVTCRTIKTAEGVPEKAPEMIICEHEYCPIVSSKNFRNITISWNLPEVKYRNGVLKRQIIYYRGDSDQILKTITIKDGNRTKYSLGNIEHSQGYYVYMVICTVAGCSHLSNKIYIPASRVFRNHEIEFHSFSDRANTGLLIGVTLATLGILFFIIFVVLYRRRYEGGSLPDVQPPHDVAENTSQISPLAAQEEYNVLETNEEAQ